ncbi:MAG: hydantoinase B/oxoprolinase family protein, partial [Rhodospirillaceae bacterium]|nr:hydantoinase B/oxoprolinase family protein [Rhodospirillaceae bacterium]
LTFAGGDTEQPKKYAVRHLDPLTLRAASPGGGGWGDPKQRDPAKVLRDVRDGVVSREAAAAIYGVVIDADGKNIDDDATAARRSG